jgi:hypothetical protein
MLHVYLKDPPPNLRQPRPAPAPKPAPVDDDAMELEEDRAQYAAQRTAQPRSQQRHDAPRATRAEPDVQDGRWGFNDTQGNSEPSYRNDLPNQQYNRRGRGGPGGGGLVSDGMLKRDNGRSNSYYRR